MNAGKGRLGTSPRLLSRCQNRPQLERAALTRVSSAPRQQQRGRCPHRRCLGWGWTLGRGFSRLQRALRPGELCVPAFPPQITEKTPSDTRGMVTTLLSCKPAPRELRTGGLELRDSQAQGDPPRSRPLTACPWRAGSLGYGAWVTEPELWSPGYRDRVTEQGIHGSTPTKELFIQSGTPVPHQQSHCSQRWRARESQNHRY